MVQCFVSHGVMIKTTVQTRVVVGRSVGGVVRTGAELGVGGLDAGPDVTGHDGGLVLLVDAEDLIREGRGSGRGREGGAAGKKEEGQQGRREGGSGSVSE